MRSILPRSVVGRSLAVAVAAVAAAACSDDTASGEGVVGGYRATTLTQVENGQRTNVLSQGAKLTMTLAADGTTTGTFIIPAALTESGTPDTLSLAGTYAYDAERQEVTFDQEADTYLRDVTWNVDGRRLTSTFGDGGTSIETVLTRD